MKVHSSILLKLCVEDFSDNAYVIYTSTLLKKDPYSATTAIPSSYLRRASLAVEMGQSPTHPPPCRLLPYLPRRLLTIRRRSTAVTPDPIRSPQNPHAATFFPVQRPCHRPRPRRPAQIGLPSHIAPRIPRRHPTDEETKSYRERQRPAAAARLAVARGGRRREQNGMAQRINRSSHAM
jgi:hypothetical protein